MSRTGWFIWGALLAASLAVFLTVQGVIDPLPDSRPNVPADFLQDVKTDTARSTRWHALRDKIVKAHPYCAYCGGTVKLQAHHIRPFYLHPELELDPENVIVLCEDPATDHHLHIGHLGNFKSEGNPDVVRDCQANEAKMRAAGTWPRKE